MCLPLPGLSHERRDIPDARRPPCSPSRRFAWAALGCPPGPQRKQAEAMHTSRTLPGAVHRSRGRIGISNHPSGPSLPTTPDARNRPYIAPKLRSRAPCLANRAVSRHLPGAPDRWQAAKPSCRAARKPLTLPFAGSGTRGSLLAPSPANRIATHPAVHSRLDCSGGPRAPSGRSLWDCAAARSRCDRIFAMSCGSSMPAMILSCPPQR
jgi:hypothetical protein